MILEAMKMEHEVIAEIDGVMRDVVVEVGETVDEGQLLAVIEEGAAGSRAGPRHRRQPSGHRGPRGPRRGRGAATH